MLLHQYNMESKARFLSWLRVFQHTFTMENQQVFLGMFFFEAVGPLGIAVCPKRISWVFESQASRISAENPWLKKPWVFQPQESKPQPPWPTQWVPLRVPPKQKSSLKCIFFCWLPISKSPTIDPQFPINHQSFFSLPSFLPSQVLLKSQLPSQADARASSAEEVDLVGSGKERSNGEGSLEATIFRKKQWYEIKTLKNEWYIQIKLDNVFFFDKSWYIKLSWNKQTESLGGCINSR